MDRRGTDRDEAKLAEKISPSGDPRWTVRIFERITSTMDTARDMFGGAEEDFPGVVLASTQSAGRGRRGRRWAESSGGLYATYAFRSKLPSSALGPLPLLIGLILRDQLSRPNCQLKLKWPNDLLSADGEKLGGILIELVEGHDYRVVLCGIGINLTARPDDIPNVADLLTLTGEKLTPFDVLAVISGPLYEGFKRFEAEGFEFFKDSWLRHALGYRNEITIKGDSAEVSGMFSGLGPHGELALTVGGEVRLFTSGDATIPPFSTSP